MKPFFLVLAHVLALAALVSPLAAAPAPSPPDSPSSPAATSSLASPGEERVEIPKDQTRQKRYAHGRYALSLAGSAWGFLVLVFLLRSRLSARMRDEVLRRTRRPNAVVFVYFALFVVVTSLLSLPLELYGGYFREREYGFARQTLAEWFGDWAKGLGIGIVLGGIFAVALYAVIRRFPRRYWLIGAAVAMAFTIFAVAVEPVFIAPLFNKFSSLAPGPLKSRLLALAHAQGIPASDVYEVDASRQSGHTNAYVAGLLGTERIVIYDTLLQTQTTREIVAVMGHEMGHYVLRHLWKGLALGGALILLGAWLVRTLYPKIAAGRGDRWGIGGISDVAGLPLVLLVVSVFSFFAAPAANAFSRWEEHQADAFSLDVVRDPDALAAGFAKFNTVDLSEYDPPRLIELWFYTHPSLEHRIEFCQEWKRTHGAPAAGAKGETS
jgi:STE24 endopeptidase